jgi:L-alanine-DL-glutamate epimerase-like enolase superfamily enzyme
VRIAHIELRRLAIPLVTPYRLAFGPVTHYDTIIVEIVGDGGERGFGEATLLTGYTDETIGGSAALACELAGELVGAGAEQARARVREVGTRAPFTATAFHTALDVAARHPLLLDNRGTRVPTLGLLQGRDEAELRDAFERLVAAGYRTVKVKIGFDVADDLRMLAAAQRVASGRCGIRVDANQGYTASEAAEFVSAVDTAGIELLEQPCKAGDWASHRKAAVAAQSRGLPLMLDESIYSVADIDRAAREHACEYVKVKLMKFVSIDALADAVERIRGLGMRPVLGNGVACDVSCWMEACVAARHVDNAGEMNGFLKASRMLFAAPLVFDQGDIVLPGGVPEIDSDALAFYTQEHASFDARTSCARS